MAAVLGTLLSIGAIAIFFFAAAFDLAHRRIPNPLVTALALLGGLRLLWALATGEASATPGADLGIALAIFAAGAVLFHLNLIGGGDVKLLAAGALWLGAASVTPFLVVTTLAGGALALVFLLWGAVARLPVEARPSLPYGVAIAAGGILVTAVA
jgi:prepilin peptidase CpaA